ncbi:hypothetical protein F0562_010800 [Nyssa sinensis]|uniref:Uncharacterized protein n=1 Tax=Nyssa sinensis TaxID=561372 RepID=A0A5J5A502_9ASTE|nr:hypothetical protein F0562_010800 [Nyssa sinensis]
MLDGWADARIKLAYGLAEAWRIALGRSKQKKDGSAGSAFDKQHSVDSGFLESLNSCGSSDGAGGMYQNYQGQETVEPESRMGNFLDEHQNAAGVTGDVQEVERSQVSAYSED